MSGAQNRWLLWNAADGSRIADGLGRVEAVADSTIVTRNGALCIYTSTDGTLLGTVPEADQVGVASDGSYVWTASVAGLAIWTTAGEQIASKPGDYSSAHIYAAPTELRAAGGPMAADKIETIAADTGASTLGLAFSGTFHSWFGDGEHFFTNIQTTVWIYDRSSTQRALLSLPSTGNLAGYGNYFWHLDDDMGLVLRIYEIGRADTPIQTHELQGVRPTISPSSNRIGLLHSGGQEIQVVVLDPAGPTKTTYPVPIPTPGNAAVFATDDSGWVVGNQYGVVHNYGTTSSPAASVTFDSGKATAIDGTLGGLAAVATASGRILLIDAATESIQDTIEFHTDHLELSADGTLLAASANAHYSPDRTLNVYSLSDLSVVSSWPSQAGGDESWLVDFTFSPDGTRVGRVEYAGSGSGEYRRTVTDLAGAQTIVTDTVRMGLPIAISPNGRYVAMPEAGGSDEWYDEFSNLYEDGILIGAVPGIVSGWVDDDQLLAHGYGNDMMVGGAYLYSTTGTPIAEFDVPERQPPSWVVFHPISATKIYTPYRHRIIDLPAGTESPWPDRQPGDGSWTIGAVAGDYIVHSSGDAVLAVPYQ